MKTSYLDYYKMILEKVSFNPLLFAKEYLKAVKILNASDAKKLDSWLVANGLKRVEANQKYVPQNLISKNIRKYENSTNSTLI